MTERPQSLGEEIANSLSHGLGFIHTRRRFWSRLLRKPRPHHRRNHIRRNDGVALRVRSAVPHRRAKALLLKLSTSDLPAHRQHLHAVHAGRAGGPWGWTLFGLVWASPSSA
jgi:hypothetical protein